FEPSAGSPGRTSLQTNPSPAPGSITPIVAVAPEGCTGSHEASFGSHSPASVGWAGAPPAPDDALAETCPLALAEARPPLPDEACALAWPLELAALVVASLPPHAAAAAIAKERSV